MHLRTWFKGADTSAVCQYLQVRYSAEMAASPCEYKRCVLATLTAANLFMKGSYGRGLWLPRQQAVKVVEFGYQFMGSYLECAHFSLLRRKTRFKISPKFHAWNHVCDYLRMELQHEDAEWCLNCCNWSTQQCEDFVGKIAALSCAVSSRSAHKQTLARYAINLHAHWEDHEA